ncbi:MAG: hypothetical protein A2138_07715 [Deltaproteobacteria bacterium RBG_16_71_12]|nr:MAG: hypothetical protein A2138_07715 [Deltaproteobacteria bacterium RBG_16_71_12]
MAAHNAPYGAAHTAAAPSESADASTIPAAPASMVGLAALYDDPAFKVLYARVHDARQALPDWDNLAHVTAFAGAAELVGELLIRPRGAQERRALAHLLWQLLPTAMRARSFLPLPDDLGRRAEDGFALVPGDVPRVAASWVAFLGDPELLPKALAHQPLVLVPRSQAKALHQKAPAVLVQAERLEGDLLHARALGAAAEPVRPTSLESVAGWLLSAGPDARGLDLRSEDDRALLLVWAQLLRERHVDGRSAFAWLQDGNAPASVKARVVDACLDAAVAAVGTFTLDPQACRFSLSSREGEGGWAEQAAAALRTVALPDGPLVREVLPRARQRGSVAELVWADALLVETGYAAGRLSALGAARAFARLATSVLAPLGVLPLSGLRDGRGAVLLQRFVEEAPGEPRLAAPRLVSFGEAVKNEPLADAWRDGRGLMLPDPKAGPRHELAAMPAWLALFLEGIDDGYRSRPPQPAAREATP